MTDTADHERPRESRTTVPGHDTTLRRSIEVEYWVIDDEGRLTEPGALTGVSAHVEGEFVEPLLEIKTTPCETTAELREELFTRLGRVLRRADELDRGLVPLATPINKAEILDRPSERTRVQDEVVGEDFEYVRHCAGTHIHFEQQPGAAIDQLNTLIALDPALALVNSAQHFRGRRLATGARSKLYRWMAYETLPHQGELWPYAEDTDEWRARLRQRYREFEAAAMEAGFDRRTVEAHFDPESAVWTPVQLRESFGTVEWRSADTARPDQIVRLADDIARIMASVPDREVCIEGRTGGNTDGRLVLPAFDAVTGYVDAAIRKGLSSAAVRAYLDRMGFDSDRYSPVAREMDQQAITPDEARHYRLEHAELLKQDVLQNNAASAD